MRSIVLSSLRLSVFVMVAVGVMFVVAVAGSNSMAVDTLPEFLPTQVQVQTEALGLSASEVEQFITVPLEDEFNGVPFVDTLRSKSVPGLSSINLTFKPGTDIYTARQFVTERVAQGPSVVNVGTPPVMLEPVSSERRVMMIGLTSNKIPLPDLSTTAYWRIRPRLLAVPGVASVSIWGQRDVQLQVLFDPARANKAGVTLEQVVNTAGDATWTSPLSFLEASSPGADGLIDLPNQRLTVQHILPIRTPADLAQVPVEDTSGKPVHLGDVATVVESHPALRGDAVLKNGAGLIMVVQKLPGADALSVTRGIDAAMADLKHGLVGVSVDTSVFRPASYIKTALRNIGLAALIGFLLAAAWLGVAARSWRVAFIGAVTIALPLLVTVLVLHAFGATFNLMTLVGLVIALGVVVDDAVFGIGTLKRHLEQAQESEDEQETVAAWEAYAEMRKPLGWAVAILLLASLPLFFVSGLPGSLLKPIVIAYSLVVLASTAAALVVTPVLANLLLRHRSAAAHVRTEAIWAQNVGRAWLRLVRRPVWAYVAVAILVVFGLASLSQTRTGAFVSPLHDRNLLVQWQAAPGTSLVEMDRITSNAGQALRLTGGVRNVASHVGQALLGDQIVSSNSAETWITLDPTADYTSTVEAIRGVIDRYQGLKHTLLTYPQASLNEATTNSGKAITVRLYGTDPQTLATRAQEIRQTLSYVQGVAVDPVAQTQTAEPSVRIQTDIPAAARYGLKPGDIRRQTAVLIAGIPVGSYYHDQQIFDVTVWSQPTIRENVADVANLLIEAPSGDRIPLKEIAQVTILPSPAEINHDRVSRFVDVTADVTDSDLGKTVNQVSARMRSLQLPLGYHTEVFSDLQTQQGANRDLWLVAFGALIGAFLLLQASFRSWGRAFLLLLTLPLAAVGALLAAIAAGAPIASSALIGLVLVLGITLRNGMVLIRGFQRMEAVAESTSGADIVFAATTETAGPVVTTAVAIALALLPFVARGNIAGMEVLFPLGAIVIGGLVTSTLLTLVIVPALYLHLFAHTPTASSPQAQGEA